MKAKELVRQILEKKENIGYQRRLAKRTVGYEQWLKEKSNEWSLQTAERDLSSELVLLKLAEGEIASYAEALMMKALRDNKSVQFLYGDEDVFSEAKEDAGNGKPKDLLSVSGKHHSMPWFKPDWSPDLLDSCFYFGSLIGVRRSRWEELEKAALTVLPEGWEATFEKETDKLYLVKDFATFEKLLHGWLKEAYCKNSNSVAHVNAVLFHGNNVEGIQKFLAKSQYLKEKQEALLENVEQQAQRAREEKKPLVSVVIPSKDQPELLQSCLESIKTSLAGNTKENHTDMAGCVGIANTEISVEVIVVDNGSNEDNKKKLENLLGGWDSGRKKWGFTIQYYYQAMEFNFSWMCNLGAEKASGELILFLNDDVILQPGVIKQMAAKALRDYTGAVGCKLLYPESQRIQHAGITNLPMGPVHKMQFFEDDIVLYFGANRGNRNFLAVTAACLMVSKQKFLEVGGFAEELRVAFNDVDLCFSLYEAGYYNVCLNDIYSYHCESVSRGSDESEEKLKRLLEERAKLYKRHPKLEGTDPYYSVHLSREGLDTGIRPAYETAGNTVQLVEKEPTVKGKLPEKCREDECLLARVESFTEGILNGYGVVLGSDNACYQMNILLKNEGMENKDNGYLVFPVEGQYRPDLQENMPDQKNVALSGFKLALTKVPKGKYRVCLLAEDKISRSFLYRETNRCIEI